ncbi:hypothetical protein [Marisediminicola sp. LYQ134]|uniref:hypothetical protein n=1 Tax=Marisediminicola sp. LYQ134 TaxID=3391061 RepID=UPI003983AB33
MSDEQRAAIVVVETPIGLLECMRKKTTHIQYEPDTQQTWPKRNARNRTPAEALRWRSFMPRKGNGGVPTTYDVDRFLRETTNEPELELKVLSELRERALNAPADHLGVGAVGLATVAIVITSAAAISADGLPADAVVIYTAAATSLFVLTTSVSLYTSGRARHAASWLAAYSDGLHRGQSALPCGVLFWRLNGWLSSKRKRARYVNKMPAGYGPRAGSN